MAVYRADACGKTTGGLDVTKDKDGVHDEWSAWYYYDVHMPMNSVSCAITLVADAVVFLGRFLDKDHPGL